MLIHTMITSLIIKKMLKRKSRSLILFISSIGRYGLMPYLNIYSSTKEYIHIFAKWLNE